MRHLLQNPGGKIFRLWFELYGDKKILVGEHGFLYSQYNYLAVIHNPDEGSNEFFETKLTLHNNPHSKKSSDSIFVVDEDKGEAWFKKNIVGSLRTFKTRVTFSISNNKNIIDYFDKGVWKIEDIIKNNNPIVNPRFHYQNGLYLKHNGFEHLVPEMYVADDKVTMYTEWNYVNGTIVKETYHNGVIDRPAKVEKIVHLAQEDAIDPKSIVKIDDEELLVRTESGFISFNYQVTDTMLDIRAFSKPKKIDITYEKIVQHSPYTYFGPPSLQRMT